MSETNPDSRMPADGLAACSCASYSRSEALRGVAARAGRGLPSIEPGMPIPAGTGLSRRSFLLRSAGMTMAVYGAASMSPRAFEEGIEDAMAAGPADAVLVSVFLSGGIDSLSVLIPAEDPTYQSFRPTLAIAPDATRVFSEDSRLQWAAQADKLRTLHGEGKLSMLPCIGYTSPNQSHFTSRHYWEVGELNPQGQVGWLGRYLDQHGSGSNPLQGLALDSKLSPSLATATNPVAAVSDPTNYNFTANGVNAPVATPMLQQFGALGGLATGDPQLGKAREATATTSRLREQLSAFAGTPTAGYPNNSFGRRMAALAALLASPLPLKVVSVQAAGGYDTHADQATTLPANLTTVSDTLFAFQRDLEARGIADRVLVHAWSEFGRRPRENGSGTDHGAGGISFLMGTRAAGTVPGAAVWPGLTGAALDGGGNLRASSDFRGVYCSLLEDWLNVDPGPIVPGADSLPRYALIDP